MSNFKASKKDIEEAINFYVAYRDNRMIAEGYKILIEIIVIKIIKDHCE